MFCEDCGRAVEGRSDKRFCNSSCRASASRKRRQNRTKALGTPHPRTSLARTVRNAADGLRTTPADVAAVQLAARYAQAIDDAEDMAEALAKLGPKLLAVLDALGATPRGRAAVQSRGEAEAIPPTVPTAQQQAGGGASTALERLRAERANRR